MKKILAILSVGIIWAFLPMLVIAYTPPTTLEEVKAWYASYGYTNCDNYINTLYNYSCPNKVYAIIRATDDISGNQNVIFFCFEKKFDTYIIDPQGGNTWFYQKDAWQQYSSCWSGLNYNFTNNQATQFTSGQSSGQMVCQNVSMPSNSKLYLSDQVPEINFDDIYYSPQIPIPTIDVYMGSEVNNPTSGQAVWNASLEFGDNSQYYIQYGYKASFPSYIDVGLASLRGDFSYNYYNYTSTNYIDIVSIESLTTAVNQSKPASYFQSSWQSFYNDYLTQSLMPEFGTQVNAMSTAMLDDAKDYYVDYMLGQIPMYGNRLEVFARYFIIDSENDNRVVVGAWNHWNSKDGSRTKERPSNYIDNVALPGNIITNTDPDYQENTDTYSSNGESTGTPATIINNNYAPNYPDYPTVVTYNHDNILLNFMDTAKQLPSFFGDFTGFLTVAFGFIPSWIWAIVGAGFTFSIVIMIIKVL